MNSLDTEQEPVQIIMTPDGYLVRAGKPATDLKGKRELGQYALEGYVIKTITIKEYRETTFKWVYDRQK